jgi:hypothetical protein
VRRSARTLIAAAVCAALIAPACSSSAPAGGSAGGGDAGPGPGSSGGDDAAASGSSGGGTGDGQASATGGSSSSGGAASGVASSSSSGATSSGADAAHDAPPGDARGPDAGSTVILDGGSSLDSIRQACVDRINMHRASIGVAALSRAPASVEACSDRGAMTDATTNSAHSSAGMCPGTGAQDTCPSLPVGGGATLLSSLMQCLDQMWAEGPPPAGTTVAQCIMNYQGCFLVHGHYINMSDSYMTQTAVSCGFYLMSNGSYWSNQDFLP